MYKNLETKSKNTKNIDSLFYEFRKPVSRNDKIIFNKVSINELINQSVENAINDVVNNIINTKINIIESENVNEIAENCKKFFQDSDFGTFEYIQRTGRSNFKVVHKSGINGTKFLKKFFEKMFRIYLKNYSIHIISNEDSLCVIFR